MLPTVVPEIAYGLLWLWLFNPLYGPINGLLTAGGEGGLTALRAAAARSGSPTRTTPAPAIILMSLFTIGEAFVVLLVARQARARPSSTSSRRSRTRTWWDVFRRITLPLHRARARSCSSCATRS